MKHKLKELGAKLKPKRGSILVYTLIIMMIILATALSIAAVTVREKKGAGTTAASTQAFAVADSGSEIALKAANDGTTVQDLGSCDSATGTVTFNIVGGEAKVIFYKNEDSTEIVQCDESASLARKVKSVGRYGGTARAVEVAVAQTVDVVDAGCPSEIESSDRAAAAFSSAVTTCRNKGNGWRLPTAEELACFVGAPGVSSSYLWARTPDHGGSDNIWVRIKLTNGIWDDNSHDESNTFRCVR